MTTPMIDRQTGEEVVTRDGPDRRYRLCFCSVCREVQRCVPENDFYEVDGSPSLMCSGCFRKPLEAKGYKLSIMI